MSDFDKFMYRYIIFLSFIIFVIGMSADDIFGQIPDVGGKFQTVVYAATQETITTPGEAPEAVTENVGGIAGFFGWLKDTVGFDAWWESTPLDDLFLSIRHFTSNLWYFFTLTTMDSGVAWITALIFAPAGIFIFWKLATLLAPGAA